MLSVPIMNWYHTNNDSIKEYYSPADNCYFVPFYGSITKYNINKVSVASISLTAPDSYLDVTMIKAAPQTKSYIHTYSSVYNNVYDGMNLVITIDRRNKSNLAISSTINLQPILNLNNGWTLTYNESDDTFRVEGDASYKYVIFNSSGAIVSRNVI